MAAMTYQLEPNGTVCDQTLVGETVILSDNHCRGLVRSTLIGGVLQFAQPKKAGLLALSTIKDCAVDAVMPQRDRNMFLARFINCRFTGVFSGIDFGCSHTVERDGDFGAVDHCDFSEAILDGCRFFNVDPVELRFPRSNHAVLVDLRTRADDVASMAWPGLLGSYLALAADMPSSLRVNVVHIPSLASLVKCSQEEVMKALKRLEGSLH